ncbi:uncharacterized protein LOC107832914 [Poecilia formosa]|uniref:uncharacterized protein LOC107832914 n=1 Tax=Poecilia formosa TaxID=48698 RepID=UPI0007B8415E|nr:PREDICTED: uncharacterized protein LOC107832914 [Poecilia formosa]
MEVTALCIHILISEFALLSTTSAQSFSAQKPDFPVVSPDQLQFFEYSSSISISCPMDKHLNTWRVMRKLYNMSPANNSEVYCIPAPSCTMETFGKHSGEYWCENDEGERSHALNILITDGPVILKFTARPVKEGSDVILHCINKNKEQRTRISDFYKDGQFFRTNYEEGLTLHNVSKSDEGFYKCNIPGVGDSAESWLAVKPGNGK